jgi:hypothetical protein
LVEWHVERIQPAGHEALMGFRRFLALLFAVAISFAPLGQGAMAEAAAPTSHHAAKAGHCDQQSQPDQHHKAADKSCCAAMCLAVVVPHGASDLAPYHPIRERPASELDRRGFLGEIATPPPRLA